LWRQRRRRRGLFLAGFDGTGDLRRRRSDWRSDGDWGRRERRGGRRRHDRCRRRIGSLERRGEATPSEVDDPSGSHRCRLRRRRLRFHDGGRKRRCFGDLGRRRRHLLRESRIRHRDADLVGNERDDDDDVEQGRDAQAHRGSPAPRHEFPKELSECLHSRGPRGVYAKVRRLSSRPPSAAKNHVGRVGQGRPAAQQAEGCGRMIAGAILPRRLTWFW